MEINLPDLSKDRSLIDCNTILPRLIQEKISTIKQDQVLLKIQMARINIIQCEIKEYESMLIKLDLDIKKRWRMIVPLDEEYLFEKKWIQTFLDDIRYLIYKIENHSNWVIKRLDITRKMHNSVAMRMNHLNLRVQFLKRGQLIHSYKLRIWIMFGNCLGLIKSY